MALEDRCSPQSAPSPPGLPQSPHYQTGATILDMSLHQPVTQSPTHTTNMLPHPAASLYQQQQLQHLHHLQQLQQLHQQQLANVAGVAFQHPGFEAANHAAALQQRLAASPGGHSAASTPTSTVTIKEEESDSIMGDSFNGEHEHMLNTAGTATEDEDDDIDVDDVDDMHTNANAARLPPPAHQQSVKPTLAFSISNILSDRFGGTEGAKLLPKQTNLNSSSIFRPFEAARAATATPSAFTRVDLLEFSRQQQAAAAAATAAMMIERANFLNCFNPAAYPRIHEEIVNSRMRRNGVIPPNSGKNIEPNMEKSALGSLCKAVSQIGQSVPTPATSANSNASAATTCISSPPPASNASTISTASSSTSAVSSLNSSPTSRLPSKSSSPQPIPPPSAVSRDSGMESSDDTRSETGSTTTEGGKNEMWPAWVYCTRYSDRPSSANIIMLNMLE
ncbi:segmentation polarity homeobox protein engrailed-like [Teleopsis dalmanni]|uniref:segmentation polarity homeobox protein engrailed-like n=1 Tax=Teleopsis dalmanni TaxID=139649 RepID=UPI0018CFDF9B|nr:segmentation polarity homeobox protein engrailed-like [Teleopsis dalmanni]